MGQRPLVIGGGDRLGLRGLEELPDLGNAGVDVPAERAALPRALALLHVGPQRGLKALGLPQGQFLRAQGGIDGAVEDQPTSVTREELGIGGAQVGAVGETQVGEHLLPVDRTQDVEIPGGADGVDMVQKPRSTGLLLAGAVHLPRSLDGGRGRRRRRVILTGPLGIELGIGETVDGG